MAKKSGYQVRISAFIEASPTDMDAMRKAIGQIEEVCRYMRMVHFLDVKHDTRFMLSKAVDDDDPPPTLGIVSVDPTAVAAAGFAKPEELDQLAIPPALDRRNRA